MDNPHGICEYELGYLAGIIDGEGTITLERTGTRRKRTGQMGLSPRIYISNTVYSLIMYCTDLFRKLKINPHIKSQDRGKWKKCYWLSVQGLSKVGKLLKAVLKYLVCKMVHAFLVLRFIEIRGHINCAKGSPYGQEELDILKKIRALNHRGPSETEDYDLWYKSAQVNDSPTRCENNGYVE